jgi:hypothetical protein
VNDRIVSEVLDAMTREHRARVERICRLVELARAAAADPDASTALTVAARAVGLSRQTLHGYAVVGLRFTNMEIAELLDRRNAKGEPISISHIEAMARNGKTDQGLLLQRAILEAMTTSKLKRTARELRGVAKPKQATRRRRRHKPG